MSRVFVIPPPPHHSSESWNPALSGESRCLSSTTIGDQSASLFGAMNCASTSLGRADTGSSPAQAIPVCLWRKAGIYAVDLSTPLLVFASAAKQSHPFPPAPRGETQRGVHQSTFLIYLLHPFHLL